MDLIQLATMSAVSAGLGAVNLRAKINRLNEGVVIEMTDLETAEEDEDASAESSDEQ